MEDKAGVWLLAFLRPREFVTSIYDINLHHHYERGLRSILTDLDNTLVEWNSPVATPKLMAWLEDAKTIGFQVCIISNNEETRVMEFAKLVGIPAVYKAGKPRKRAYRKTMAMLSTTPRETMMVGDQIFTDVLGGNRLGLYTILVKPIHQQEFIGTKVMRKLERLVLRQMPEPTINKVNEKSER